MPVSHSMVCEVHITNLIDISDLFVHNKHDSGYIVRREVKIGNAYHCLSL